MLESVLNSSMIYYVLGVVTMGGIISKVIASVALRNLVQAAGDMSKSTHSFMKLVRAKFEHACMVNDYVENIEVFVEKYIRQYQVGGISLYGWRRLERIFLVLLGLFTLYISAGTYYYAGAGTVMLQRILMGASMFALLLGIYQLVDEKLHIATVKVYMVDYLENVCARRYEKNQGLKEKNVIPSSVSQEREEYNYAGKLEEQMMNIERKRQSKREGVVEVAADQPVTKQIEKQISAKLQEKKELQQRAQEEAQKRQELKKQTQEEYMPNEAAIREILQEFMA